MEDWSDKLNSWSVKCIFLTYITSPFVLHLLAYYGHILLHNSYKIYIKVTLICRHDYQLSVLLQNIIIVNNKVIWLKSTCICLYYAEIFDVAVWHVLEYVSTQLNWRNWYVQLIDFHFECNHCPTFWTTSDHKLLRGVYIFP
jgi:hypothetical protein